MYRLPGQHLGEGEGAVDRRQAGAMAQHPAHRDLALAVGSELRPIAGHRRIEVDRAALGQPQQTRRGDALGGREDEVERVLAPRPPGLAVGPAAPQIDHRLVVPVDGTGGTDLAEALEARREHLAHGGEPRLHFAADHPIIHRRTRARSTWVSDEG